MDEKLYDVFLMVHVPINVVVTAPNKKEAKRIAEEMYYDGDLSDRVITSHGENTGTVTCTSIERVD